MWKPFVKVWDKLEAAYVAEGGPLEERAGLYE